MDNLKENFTTPMMITYEIISIFIKISYYC